jgi:hypothetical protein
MLERWRNNSCQGKTKVLGEQPELVPLCKPQILPELPRKVASLSAYTQLLTWRTRALLFVDSTGF